MPEGDTIWRTANRMRRALAGRAIVGVPVCVRSIRPEALVGRIIREVEARGKALLVHLEGGDALFSHMGMTGSWHLYRSGERWRKSRSAARLVLSVDAGDAVLFTPNQLSFVPDGALAGHPFLRRLGPDVLAEAFDVAHAAERLAQPSARSMTIAEALLDQSLICGIGNIFKSETLFAAGVHPLRLARELTNEERVLVVQRARDLMLPCVTDETRTLRGRARGADRFWVYQRCGRDCLRCGADVIAMTRQGTRARSTYYCSTCQPAGDIDDPSGESEGDALDR